MISRSPRHLSSIRALRAPAVVALLGLVTVGCDKAALLAPTNSSITINAASRILPTGGSTEITATVIENSGSAVPNGTTVRFSTTLGRLEPAEAQTRNGVATTTFHAGNDSGVATIRAISGLAQGSSGGDNGTVANVVEITIGAAAIETISLRANPGSVAFGGGTVDLVATVVTESGRSLAGIPVTFSTTQGTFSSSRVTTDENGEARTQLTTTQDATVVATAGAKSSSEVTVDVRDADPVLAVSITATSSTAVPTVGQSFRLVANVTPTTLVNQIESYHWVFGDGTEATTNGNDVSHIYTTNGVKTVTVTARAADGRAVTSQTQIIVSGI